MTNAELLFLVPRFRFYRRKHDEWGSLYLVMQERIYRDECVEHCRTYAEQEGDAEGMALADLLMEMNMRQRSKLAQVIGRPRSYARGAKGESRRLMDAVVRDCAIKSSS